MRICIISDSYPTLPNFGGISVYTQTAAHALSERGHTVHVLIGRLDQQEDFQDGAVQVHIRPVRWIPFFCRWLPTLGESAHLAVALQKLHRQYHFDVVEFPNWEAPGLVSEFLRVASIVVRLHTSSLEPIVAQGRTPLLSERFVIWAERLSSRLAQATVTHSNSHRDSLGKKYGLQNVQVIPHGIVIPPAPSEPTESGLSVLCVGPLTARKGITTLLAAIPLVLQSVPEAVFWIVGNDPGNKIESGFRTANPDLPHDRGRFLGFVSGQELEQLYATCAIYASASVYESFGLTFVEAMSHAKPVIACAISAMTEIVSPEDNGLLVPPQDPPAFTAALVRLLKDPALRRRMGKSGRQIAIRKYSAQQMAESIEQFYLKQIPRAT